MIELKDYINESLYGKLLGLSNKTKFIFKNIKQGGRDLINDIKQNYDTILKKLKNQKLVISATSVEEYNKQCDELMDICANSDDRIEALKVYFVKNTDPNFGNFTIYIVADKEEQKTYKTVVDRENNWPGTIAFKEIVDEVFIKNTYYILSFDSENNFTYVIKENGKNMVDEFDKKFKDFGFRLTPKLNKWLEALRDLSDIYEDMK